MSWRSILITAPTIGFPSAPLTVPSMPETWARAAAAKPRKHAANTARFLILLCMQISRPLKHQSTTTPRASKQRTQLELRPCSCELQKGPISVCSYRLSTAPQSQAAAQPDTKNDGLPYGRLRQLPELRVIQNFCRTWPVD